MLNVQKSALMVAKLMLVLTWGITLNFCLPALADDTAGSTASPPEDAATPTIPQPSGTAQITVEPAIGTTDVGGNFRRYEQYTTPSDGLYLNQFHLSASTGSDGSLLDLLGHDVGKASEGESLWAAAGYGSIVLEGLRRDSTFYSDFSTDGQPQSRKDNALDLSVRAKSSLLNLTYQDVSLESPGSTATPGSPAAEDWLRSVSGVSFSSNENNWLTRLGYQNEQVIFNEGAQYSTHNASYGLSIAPPLSERSTLEANATFTQTTLDTVAIEPQHLDVTVEGSHDFPADLTVSGNLFYNELNNSITENAFADHDAGGQVEADYSGLRHALISFGGGLQRVGYINDPQTEQTDAVENNAFAKFTYRYSKQLKIKGYATYDWTNNRPITIDTFMPSIGSLVWSNKYVQSVEATYTPSYRSGITAQWQNTAWNNTDFSTHNLMSISDITTWWIPQDKYTVYGTYLAQDFLLDVPAAPDDGTSNSKTFVLGVTRQFSRALSLDMAYNLTNVDGASAQGLHYVSLGANYVTKAGDRWSGTIAFDNFDDNVDGDLDYYACRFQMEYSKTLF